MRFSPFKIIIVALLALSVTVLWGAEKELKWYSFNEGLQKAQKENKPMIVDFYADWCSWCKVMDEKTFGDKTIQSILSKDFILVRIDTDKDEKITYNGNTFSTREFQGYMQVTGLPTLAFFDKKGKAITTLPGYVNPTQLKPVLGYISSECYAKQVSFKEFTEAGGKCTK